VAPDQGGALSRGAWICFLDESGASLHPPVRRTWAPRGHTPVLRHRMRGRKRISMAGVCCYRPDGTDARLAFHLREGAYDTAQLIPIVQALGQLLGGNAPVILIWDNLPAHTSLAMRAWVRAQHAWLQVEYLRAGPEPGGELVGQPEGSGAGQPCLPVAGGAGRSGRAGHRPGAG
jgi:DDE superfamily endonuclease